MSSLTIEFGEWLGWAANDRVAGPLTLVDKSVETRPRANAATISARGLLLCPGFMDIHVHLREPGQSHKETIESGTAAAMAGGFTYVACMPNTVPALDTPDTVRWVIDRAKNIGHCEGGVVAAITCGRKGDELTDFAALLAAGAVAFSDDGVGVERDDVMLRAFERAARIDALLIQHCEYKAISAGGVMHQGAVSQKLGFPGLDPRSEETMIERDLDLCRRTGGRFHVAHISTARAVELVRRGKAEGLPVTSEVTPHHLLLTDEACTSGDSNTKMHPPLRSTADVDACRRGLLDGTIDCIATDHAPHAADEKAAGFLKAPPGIVGLETAVGLVAKAMIETNLTGWPDVVRWFTSGPARVLRLPCPTMEPQQSANLTLIDPTLEWTVDPAGFRSKGRNTPFGGQRLRGRSVAVVRGNKLAECFPGALNGRLG